MNNVVHGCSERNPSQNLSCSVVSSGGGFWSHRAGETNRRLLRFPDQAEIPENDHKILLGQSATERERLSLELMDLMCAVQIAGDKYHRNSRIGIFPLRDTILR